MEKEHFNFKNKLGEKSITNQGYEIEIIEYFGTFNCTIRFNDERGTIRKRVAYKEFKSGGVNNYFHPTVCGIGYLGFKDNYQKENKQYMAIWRSMLNRAYNNIFHIEYTSYKDVTVCKEWLNFQNFAQWMDKNYNPEKMEGWQLDKDILIKGNKIYSPDTCCFVPKQINTLFIKCDKVRGEYPIGVIKNENKYIAQVSKNNMRFKSKSFDTPEEAFEEYKKEKESYIKEVAEKWRGQITEQVYNTLVNYQVEIND